MHIGRASFRGPSEALLLKNWSGSLFFFCPSPVTYMLRAGHLVVAWQGNSQECISCALFDTSGSQAFCEAQLSVCLQLHLSYSWVQFCVYSTGVLLYPALASLSQLAQSFLNQDSRQLRCASFHPQVRGRRASCLLI